MSKKFSKKVLFSSLIAFCSGINVNAMQSSKTFDNNNLKVSKNDSFEIKGQKGVSTGTLAASNVVSFTVGGLAGYFGAQKFSVVPIVEENIKLRSENESLKKKGNPISKEDYDKKCKEVEKLNAKVAELEKKLTPQPGPIGDNPEDLKKEITRLNDQLKIFTDVWGDPSDDDKMNKMKALYMWRYGEKDYRSYKWLTDFAKGQLRNCVHEEILEGINYDERANQFCQGLSSTAQDNWFTGVCYLVQRNAGRAPAFYSRAMGQFKAFLEDLRRSLLDT